MFGEFNYLARYGYIALPVWVFAEQAGLPLPAAPVLLAAGAMAASGRLDLRLTILLAVGAALTADLIWFHLGRSRGPSVLGRLCRLSMEPDSCVRRTKHFINRHGLRSLLVAKFIPGLNAIASPVVGSLGISPWTYVFVDLVGTLLWVLVFELLGVVFASQLGRVGSYASNTGILLAAVLFVLAATVYLRRKHLRRKAFLRDLRMSRITPDELKRKLDSHELLSIVDLRHPLDLLPEPFMIPGSIRIPVEDLEKRKEEIPRDREVILYCTCPNEASSAATAAKLRRIGISKVRPLLGGFHRWRELGYPVESAFNTGNDEIEFSLAVGAAE